MMWLLIDSRGVGGAERHVATLAESLLRRGLDPQVVLYADYGPHAWLAQLEEAGLPVRILNGSFSGLLRALAGTRPLLVHTHGYKAGILGRFAGRMLNIPVVSTFHSGERPKYPVSVYQFVDNWTSFLGARIAVSTAIAARLPFSARLIPSFVPKQPGPQGPFSNRVAFVGRLSVEKGPDNFCELARRSPPGLEWHVYGDGPMRRELERQYGDLVHFHGVVTDVGRVWPTLGLLVMPSRFEGVPLAALEALAAGVPVLASRVGGLPTIVIPDETGWLFDPGNLDDALSKLDAWRALGRDRHCAFRASCRHHVEANFSEGVVLPKIIDVYRQAGAAVPKVPVLAGECEA